MRPVQGYLTEDGTYYPKEEDARLHDAIQVVKGLCESHKPQPIAPERFLYLLNAWGPQIREFIDANEAAKDNQVKSDTSPSSGDTTYHSNGDALDAPMVELKVSGHDDVSDVGNRTRTEGIQQRKSKHGA